MEVKLSEKTSVEIAMLNGYESMVADRYVGSDPSPILLMKTYAICSLRKITRDGKTIEVKPLANQAEFENLAKDLSVSELGVLVEGFSQVAKPSEEVVKNS